MPTFRSAYAIGDTVRLIDPHWDGDTVSPTQCWWVSGIHTTQLDTGQCWCHFVLASGPATQRVREYYTAIRWEQMEPWELSIRKVQVTL